MSSLPSLAALATHLEQTGQTQRGGDPALAVAEYLWQIEQAVLNDPRSLQSQIGPSGLGHECTRCLARMLAQIPQLPEADADRWLTAIGKAVHAWLAEVFQAANEIDLDLDALGYFSEAGVQPVIDPGTIRYLTELPVDVGEISGTPITGSLDLYDAVDASVNDWKIVGPTTLKKVRADGSGCSLQYQRQVMLYGRGATRRGLPVDTVRVVFIPRQSMRLRDARVWSAPYDEQVALDVLERANAIQAAVDSVTVSDLWPVFLANLPADPDCMDCARYGDTSGRPPYRPPTGAERTESAFTQLLG